MREAVVAPANADLRGAQLGIVDCDVHPMLPNGKAVQPYLTTAWQKRFAHVNAAVSEFYSVRYRNRPTKTHPDAIPPGGGPPGSDPNFLIKDHIEPNNISCALLLPHEMQQVSAWSDAD